MIVVGVLLIFIFLIGLILVLVTFDSDDSDHVGFGIGLGLVLLSGILILVNEITKDSPTKRSIKENTLSVEVKIEQKDGVEISRDTIYVFTPIKK